MLTKNKTTAKLDRYGWTEPGAGGVFERIPKGELKVDSNYQRGASNKRVNEIASNFSWAAFGVILVARRRDGELCVFDGQHRALAAVKRDDVDRLPCLVFEFDELTEEAQAFVLANTCRGPVRALARFKARLQAEDNDALAIREVVEACGYTIPEKPTGRKGELACIGAVEEVAKRGASHLFRVLSLCAELYGHQPPHSRLVKTLSYLDQHIAKTSGDNLDRLDIREKLLALGENALQNAASNAAELCNKGGERIWAAGIIGAFNKGKRTKKIAEILYS